MEQALSLVQRYSTAQHSTKAWLETAGAFLQRVSLGVDQENLSESIEELQDILSHERAFKAGLEELRSLNPRLEPFVKPAAAMQELRRRVEEMRLRNTKFKQQLNEQDNVLQRCVWVCVGVYRHLQMQNVLKLRFLLICIGLSQPLLNMTD